MILLCFVYKELRDAEMKAAAAVVGQPRSRQALAHKLMAERRYRLKLNYENDRRLMGVDQKGLLKAYLADMSQNVNSAIMKVHKHQYKVAQGPKHIIENDGEVDISTWNQFQTSIPDIKEQHENPFDGRKIGISKKVQEEMALKDSQWWTGSKKCPGCGDGFTKQ